MDYEMGEDALLWDEFSPSVFEARVESGSLLMCSIDLRERLEERPVARQMLHSLFRYAGSPSFAPNHEVSVEQIQGLFR